MTDIPLAQLERQSVQDVPDARNGETGDGFWYGTYSRGDYLPQWGTRERERYLRTYYRHEFNWMGQSAFGGLIKKVKSAPWEIKGKRRVTYFQQVLREADFGRGWGSLLSKVLLDYLRQDAGGFIEVIAPGNPLKAPTGPVTGLAPLDSYRCLPTGDPEYPVIYYSRKGQLHLMHRTRVIQIVDMPDGDESRPGYGLCALSRAISIVAQQIYMGRYITAQLDDKPKPGIMVASNMTRAQVMQAFDEFKAESQRDELPAWGNAVIVASTDPTAPAKIDYLTFSQPPNGWSYKEYNDLHVNAWALALGVDVQELWQLSGGNIGSGQQSQILHAKSQGKAYGDILTSLERVLNDVLPETLEFEFKRHDPYEAQERAATAQMWAGFTQAVGDNMTADEKRRLLANMVEAAKDAITDENGEIVRMDDVSDEPPEEQTAGDTTPQDTSTPDPAAAAERQVVGDINKSSTTARAPNAPPNIAATPQPAQPNPVPQQVTTGGKPSADEIIKMLRAGLITIGQAQEQLGQPVDPLFADMYMKDGVPVPKEVLTRLYETAFGRGVDTFSNALAAPPSSETKAIQATRIDFELAFEDLLAARKELSERSMAARLRALLRQHGYFAFQDGLEDGGVKDGVLDDEDEAEFARILASQNTYVNNFAKDAAALSDAQAAVKPEMWWKSVELFYDAGRRSADRNGMYEWVLGATEEHCADCTRLNGQIHRMKDWVRKQWTPKSDRLECGGYFCDCRLVKRENVRAQGKF